MPGWLRWTYNSPNKKQQQKQLSLLPGEEQGHAEGSGHDADLVVAVPELDRQVGHRLGNALNLNQFS